VRELHAHPLLRRPLALSHSVIVAYIDGGARGNPGPAGYGAHIQDADGNLLAELHGGLGIATNNVAEYNGLLAALQWVIDHGHRAVRIRADSELLVKQMRGEYKVKHPGLQPLAARARLLTGQLDRVIFEHVRREQNRDADRLSNVGMDEAEQALRTPPSPTPPLGQGDLF
jgi:ribonuclease HI